MSRSVVAAMTAYALEWREAEVKLNQNESPFDVPAEMKEAALSAMRTRPWNRYPDFEAMALRQAIATTRGLQPANILVGNGSNELLAASIGTFVGPGTPVILLRPTFPLYEKLVTVAGGFPLPVDLDPGSGRLPVDRILETVATHPQSVTILCTPNNPTGGALMPEELTALLRSRTMLLLDRAYGDFERQPLNPPLAANLVHFRTFSKAFGLAALRVGWLESTEQNCKEIRKVKLPYSLNVFSEAAGVAALRSGYAERNVARILAERERMLEAMRALPGLQLFPTSANFICFRVPDASRLFEQLLERGVLVRNVSGYPGLQRCLRLSVGSAEQNDACIQIMKEIL